MSQTRRQTLVAVLRGTNGYSLGQLNAMNAVEGVQEFLTAAAAAGVSNTELADRLVAFKENGGSGLANAIASISFTDTEADCGEAVEAAKAALTQALDALNAVSK